VNVRVGDNMYMDMDREWEICSGGRRVLRGRIGGAVLTADKLDLSAEVWKLRPPCPTRIWMEAPVMPMIPNPVSGLPPCGTQYEALDCMDQPMAPLALIHTAGV
jgi:hypothetical protein